MSGGKRPGSGRKPAKFNAEQLERLLDQGMTQLQAAARIGITLGVIQYYYKTKGKHGTTP